MKLEICIFAIVFNLTYLIVLNVFIINIICAPPTAAKHRSWNKNHRYQKVLSVGGMDGTKARVLLEWTIDLERETVTFDLTAETTGYVGFGLKSPSSLLEANYDTGGMGQSDIVIGGIHPNSTSYFSDYHGIGNYAPVRDASQDWDLHKIFENATHTFLRFSRRFDTCDREEDIAIEWMQSLQAMWALGSTDKIMYHAAERGTELLSLFSDAPETLSPPPQTSEMMKGYRSWTTMVNVEMKKEHAYHCTFHRGPRLIKSLHAVAFTPIISDPTATRHVHHFCFYQCKLSSEKDAEEVFEPLVGLKEGTDCFTSESSLPIRLCMKTVYLWCPGEKGMFLPEEAGYLLDHSENEKPTYFMFEVHYENPGGIFKGVSFDVGIQVFYTEQLRKFNVGDLAVAHAVSDSLFIPPHSNKFKIEGRCSAACTEKSVPNGGVTVISVMLHAHELAKRIKLRHFRNETELPWLAVEHEYNPKSQKMKRILDKRKIYPGDSLVVECEYNTQSRDTVTTGGFSATSEMCTAFLLYYPKFELDDCSSQYPTEKLYEYFGYQAWPENGTNHKTQDAPNFPTFINDNIPEWTAALRKDIQELLILSNHRASCIIPKENNEHEDHNTAISVAQPITIQPVYKPPHKKIFVRKTNLNNDRFRCEQNANESLEMNAP